MNSSLSKVPFPPVLILKIPPSSLLDSWQWWHFIFGDGTEIVQILFLSAVPRIGSALCYFDKRPESTNLKRQEDSTGFGFCSWLVASWLCCYSVVSSLIPTGEHTWGSCSPHGQRCTHCKNMKPCTRPYLSSLPPSHRLPLTLLRDTFPNDKTRVPHGSSPFWLRHLLKCLIVFFLSTYVATLASLYLLGKKSYTYWFIHLKHLSSWTLR